MGLTFNGVHSSNFGLKAKIIRPLLPGVNDNYADIPGRAGSIIYPGKPIDRYITVEFGFMPSSRELYRSKVWEISAWLYTQDRAALVFDDEPDKTYMGKIEGQIDLGQAFLLGQFSAVFRCEPFAYGAEETNNFTADVVTVTNSGTFETWPIFDATFTATATEFKVALSTKYIRVVNAFAVGNTLHIDAGTGAILINGSRAMDKLDWQNSEFFSLAAGENALAITPTGKCAATVKHTPRWI